VAAGGASGRKIACHEPENGDLQVEICY